MSDDPALEGFTGFGPTLMSLFGMATGSTFPDSMDPLVGKLRWFILIFLPFTCLTILLFTPLMLAVVYNAYETNAKSRLKEFYIQRNRALSTIFVLLSTREAGSTERTISREVFGKFIRHLKRLPDMRHLKSSNIEIMFQALDDDQSRTLSPCEFLDACGCLMHHFWVTEMDSILVRKFGLRLDAVSRLVHSGKLDSAVMGLILTNAALVLVESYWDCTEQVSPPWADVMETILSVFYVVDVLLRLSVTSFGTYWAVPGNRFDFVVSWALFLAGFLTLFDAAKHMRWLMTYFTALRMLRVFRLIRNIKRFQTLYACLKNLWLISGDMVLMLGVMMLGFGMLGCGLFGGCLYSENPLLKGSDYLKEGYLLWNFNDMLSGVLTVFIMLVNTYMPVYVDACNRVASIPGAGTFYCIFVFFFGVSVGFNIVTAFSIDVFVSLREHVLEEVATEEVQNLSTMREKLKEQNKVLHMVVPSDELRMRALAGVIDGLEEAIQEARDEVLEHFARVGDDEQALVISGLSDWKAKKKPRDAQMDASGHVVSVGAPEIESGPAGHSLAALRKRASNWRLGEARTPAKGSEVPTSKQSSPERLCTAARLEREAAGGFAARPPTAGSPPEPEDEEGRGEGVPWHPVSGSAPFLSAWIGEDEADGGRRDAPSGAAAEEEEASPLAPGGVGDGRGDSATDAHLAALAAQVAELRAAQVGFEAEMRRRETLEQARFEEERRRFDILLEEERARRDAAEVEARRERELRVLDLRRNWLEEVHSSSASPASPPSAALRLGGRSPTANEQVPSPASWEVGVSSPPSVASPAVAAVFAPPTSSSTTWSHLPRASVVASRTQSPLRAQDFVGSGAGSLRLSGVGLPPGVAVLGLAGSPSRLAATLSNVPSVLARSRGHAQEGKMLAPSASPGAPSGLATGNSTGAPAVVGVAGASLRPARVGPLSPTAASAAALAAAVVRSRSIPNGRPGPARFGGAGPLLPTSPLLVLRGLGASASVSAPAGPPAAPGSLSPTVIARPVPVTGATSVAFPMPQPVRPSMVVRSSSAVAVPTGALRRPGPAVVVATAQQGNSPRGAGSPNGTTQD